MAMLAAMIGGIQNSFMRGFTITLGDEDSLAYVGTYAYFAIAVSLASF
jgi:hypothetical protein